jgi:hypothetical protein
MHRNIFLKVIREKYLNRCGKKEEGRLESTALTTEISKY